MCGRQPTEIATSWTCLSLAITCKKLSLEVCVTEHLISDRFSVVAGMSVGQTPRRASRTVSSRNIRSVSRDAFSHNIAAGVNDTGSTLDDTDVHMACDSYLALVRRTLDKHAPVVSRNSLL